MKNIFLSQFKSSVKAIIPIVLIVLLLCILSSNTTYELICLVPGFVIGALFLALGLALFNMGTDISMIDFGTKVGNHLTKKNSVWFLLIMSFVIGFIITITEPDLRVFTSQVPAVSSAVLISAVGLGVALFLVLAVLRMLLQYKYSYFIIVLYIITFGLAFFSSQEFIPLAFDSGGVTTGPISVPFVVALGAGLSFSRNDKTKKEDSFGIISFCSIGPIIVVLLLGLIYNAKSSYAPYEVLEYSNFFEVIKTFFANFPHYFKEVFISLSPIAMFFAFYNISYLKLNKKNVIKVVAGFSFILVGLSIFLTGVNTGFMPMGYKVGEYLSDYQYLLIPISILFGYFIVTSEPAIGVLTEQIETVTNGNIKKNVINVAISISVAIACGLSILRIITGLSILYFLVPIYLIAILLMPIVPQVFTSIAFDSGGVASGTLTATFLLPFAIGVAETLSKNVLTDAFGLIALVASVPLISIQVLGLIYQIDKNRKIRYVDPVYNEEIIDY